MAQPGRKVRIVTARAGDPVQLELAKAWLKRHGLEGLPITNRKDFDMLQLWDDKARRVERNTGQPCKGCAGTGKHNAENHSERESILTDC